MSGVNYNKIDKISHLLYLNNYGISRSSFFLDSYLNKNRIKNINIENSVFVTGLARAGTTILFNTIFNSDEYASLKYSNMPFLLMPNIWSKIHHAKKTELKERIHGDGILVNEESPEAFDEYFWKVFLKDSYISDKYLFPHKISDKILTDYIHYIQLICLSQNRKKYLCKNNNNILRLNSLAELSFDKIFLLVYRHPLEHAMSLLKEHQLFSGVHQKDNFSLQYFDFLGHHEFGLHHKPFLLNTQSESELSSLSKDSPDYWLFVWKQYYNYVIDYLSDVVEPICFDDIVNNPKLITSYLNKILKTEQIPEIQRREKSSSYPFAFKNEDLYQECLMIYTKLNSLRRYV